MTEVINSSSAKAALWIAATGTREAGIMWESPAPV
jgi:hypothetical protein